MPSGSFFAAVPLCEITADHNPSCSTCHLNTYTCPGHVGHIDLPVPVYHVSFMDQILRLLRSKCAYCGYLKLHPAEVNRFECKLRLVRHGLVKATQDLEEIHLSSKKPKTNLAVQEDVEDEVEESEEEDMDTLINRRNAFVKRAIRKAGISKSWGEVTNKIESVAEERRAIIKEFLGSIVKTKTCGRCKG